LSSLESSFLSFSGPERGLAKGPEGRREADDGMCLLGEVDREIEWCGWAGLLVCPPPWPWVVDDEPDAVAVVGRAYRCFDILSLVLAGLFVLGLPSADG
jgi:hypothetical protein